MSFKKLTIKIELFENISTTFDEILKGGNIE